MKNAVFWVVTPCGSCKNQSLGGTYRLHHQGGKNQRARNTVVTAYISEENIVSIFTVERITDLGRTLFNANVVVR
jgi:hypothetical protein